jgi:hypothetical protein
LPPENSNAAATAAQPAWQPTIVQPPQPTPEPRAPGPGVPTKPKLNFGGLAQKAPAAKAGKEYPVLPDPTGDIAQYAAAFLDAEEKEKAATGAKEAARAVLIEHARPFYFASQAGRAELVSSVAVHSPKGEVRVTFKNRYSSLDDEKYGRVEFIIGAETAGRYFTQTFSINVDSAKIPSDRMQAVIDAMQALAQSQNIVDAITVKIGYAPTEQWHGARFRELPSDKNLELENLDAKGFCQVAVGAARGKG